MIENYTENGIKIESLSTNSGQKVKRCCDFCNDISIMSYRDINKQRKNYLKKYGIVKDRCHKCQIKSLAQERFKRPKKLKIMVGGYNHIIDNETGKRKPEHRKIVEELIKRELLPEEVVHHINGIKTDNRPSNLVLLPDEYSHIKLHRDLEKLVLTLVEKNIIKFDKNKIEYFLRDDLILEESLGFDNISIKQKKNICKSRLEVDISSEIIKGITRPIPLIAANMSTVIDADFYIKLYKLGAFGILHRAFQNENAYLKEVEKITKNCEWVATSIGIGQSQYELAKRLIDKGSNILTIDIAHGYSDEVIDLGRKLKKEFPHIKMIVGNTTNPEMLKEIADFADALKVGLAQGFACETKNTAGCTEKQFSAVLKFKELSKSLGIPIISDGGIREGADFVKAIGAGANSVMAGSIFAACPESVGQVVEIEGQKKKLYAGMASEHVQNEWKLGLKSGTCAEGGVRYLDINNGIEYTLNHYSGSLRSGITYAGTKNIKDFQENVEFIKLL